MNPYPSNRWARAEAERCLQCHDAPCTASCPAGIDIPCFIAMVRSGNLRGAAEVIKSANALANVCGKICPEEVFCQAACLRRKQDRPIAIRELHFHATRHEAAQGYSRPRSFASNGRSVGVIGGGPAGLACSLELAKLGYRIVLYDRKPPGGVPRNSIPAFRLTEQELCLDMDFLSRFLVFQQEEIDDGRFERIRPAYDAMFLAVGLGEDRPLAIPGAELQGVLPVLTFLELAKADPARCPRGKRTVVVGGGNVSLDAASTAMRMGHSEVVLLYRRGEREMRVWRSELEEARASGVEISFFTTPIGITGRSSVEGVRCRRTRLSAELDASGRRVPVEIEGSDFLLEADLVIHAIGQVPGGSLLDRLSRTPSGYVKVDESFSTSMPGVFAGGDLVGGEGTVVQSVEQGKRAALGIHAYLSAGTRA